MIDVCKDRYEWNELVGNSTPFHTWEWLKLMETHSRKKILGRKKRAKLYPLKVMDGNTPIGVCPIFLYEGWPRFAFSPPACVETLYLGPLMIDESLKRCKRESRVLKLIEDINEFIEGLKPNFVLIHTLLEDVRPFKWLNYEVEPRYTYVLDLKSIDDVWKGYHRSLRRGIEKAKRKGITVRSGDRRDLEIIFDLLNDRNRIHTTKDFVFDVYDNFNVEVFVAEHQGESLSGIVNVCYGNRVYFWIGSPKFSFKGVNPNELVFYESMKWALENGYREYEIMGADDRTLYDFKRKFNGKLKMFFTVRKLRPSILRVLEATYRSIKPRYG